MNPSPRSEAATEDGPGSGRARIVLPVLLLVLVWACGPPRERFRGALASPEALTEAFLQALEAGDRPRLEGLALSAQEFQLEVFPEMPAYGNIPPDLAWSQLAARSLYGLSTVLHAQRGRSWELEEIVFRGGQTAYQTFVVHREPMLRLRDRRTGEEREMALFGSLLEHDGRYKLFSFNIDR
ncbi:MAG: hypothetical protein LJF15_04675 [Acidobacteria bacterium]|jgi:hypothetical protein|nr:hypothetical protein [Acidobacteriota bacterium]